MLKVHVKWRSNESSQKFVILNIRKTNVSWKFVELSRLWSSEIGFFLQKFSGKLQLL